MPPPLTTAAGFTQWVVDWPSLVVCVLLGLAYVRAARRTTWPLIRTVSFLSGLVTVLLVTCSFIGAYDRVLFWPRAIQNVVLLMGASMLLALGAPLTLCLRTAPMQVVRRLRTFGHGRFARALTFPLSATVLFVVPLPLLYLSPLFEATLRHGVVDVLVRAALVLCGSAYYWSRLGVDPTPREGTHAVSFAISLAEALIDGVLGIIVWLGPLIAHDFYSEIGRTWGPSMHRDQTIGAIGLWLGGDLIGIPYLVALFVQWVRDDTHRARQVDAELDLAERARSQGHRPSTSEPAAGSMQSGLWWEDDPELSRRYGRDPDA